MFRITEIADSILVTTIHLLLTTTTEQSGQQQPTTTTQQSGEDTWPFIGPQNTVIQFIVGGSAVLYES